MTLEPAQENIFKFDSNDILKFYSTSGTSNKMPNSPTFSPNKQLVDEKEKKRKNFKIINLISSQNKQQKIQFKINKIECFKFIISILLIKLIISYFDYDDVLPYKIIHDLNYDKILEEIPKENNELIKVKEFGTYKTFIAPEMIKKFNQYIDICKKGKLIDNKKYIPSKEPKISVIIPLYKGEKYLQYSLRSVQNQKMKDLEIILIDDNSLDDTSLLIDKYIKEDPRIIFIRNEVNRKILYSKSMAALNAKGKYILQIDQDDIFIRDDLFDKLYNEAETNNLDLIQFRDITKNNLHLNKKTIVNCVGRHYILPKYNQLKTQPELKDTLYINNNIFLLWGLLIKTNIYKKALYYLWKIIINYEIIFHEDYIILFMIIVLSKKYKYMNYFSLIHLNNIHSSSNNHWNLKEYYLSVLFFSNIVSDYYIKYNPTDIKILLNFVYLFIKEFTKGKTLFPNLFNTVINKILYNNYLPLDDRNYLMNKFDIKKDVSNFAKPQELNDIYFFQNMNSSIHNYDKNKEKNFQNISISIIIICREFKYLNKTIYSIENQNFTNYEVILIFDDIDKKDEFTLIKNFTENYSNIKLYKNLKKKGVLNSTFEGIQISKGKYFLILQPGYTLTKSNTLYEFSNYINNINEDIIEFDLLINNKIEIDKENLMLYRCNHYNSRVKEEIKSIKFNKKMNEIDQQKDLLFNKLIKTESFKKSIRNFKLNNNKTIDIYYDDIILFSLLKSNATFKHINIYGIIKYSPLTDELYKNNKENIIDESIFYINFLYANTNNTFIEKEFVLNEFFNLLALIYNKNNNVKNDAFNLYKKFYNSNCISSYNKRLLRLYFHSLRN